ncbi:(-)-isopiperitenol/(-)-carveol dehydrogenase [Hibiscus syriacus]|uniref:(-)-isopiperitenol/(-)-carveol dehydrogenase n=1 Tax=Hibiscus syriacus TaxID=106335 RepID=A0A6A3A3P5_HIBSY|nr:(-)-isopiperitenol/(-)-carveol dehydrogenase [Hibiscus syriacus]
MAISTSSPVAYLTRIEHSNFPSKNPQFNPFFPSRKPLTIVNMAPKKKVNKYDSGWEKQWFGAGIFYEGSEEAEELGLTLSSIEKLGVFSKAEELGLLSLLEKAASVSPSTLASAALPALVAALLAVVIIPDDSVGLVAVQAVVAGALVVAAAGLFVGSVVLGGLQEAD